jgi:glucose-6-phosphate isomerase
MIHTSCYSPLSNKPSQDWISSTLDDFNKLISRPDIGFFHLPKNNALINESRDVFLKFQDRKTFVHVGIGGSSLGPEMLIKALKNNDRQFIFLNNIDPDELHQQLGSICAQESVFYIVSKSGGTAETLATYVILRQFLEDQGIAAKDFHRYFVFATDPHKSLLLDIAKTEAITCLSVPSNIGGRFCVLTSVGLFPALFANIDVEKLMFGAAQMSERCLEHSLEKNPLLNLTWFIWNHYQTSQLSQTVMMPYSSKLRELSAWFVQLWAESLGKKHNLENKEVLTGLTPINSYGATDQHSQMQLFMHGPRDKVMVMIDVQEFEHDFMLHRALDHQGEKWQELAPHTLAQLMKAEFLGTLQALELEQRPYFRLSLERLDESAMGALIILFESLTAMTGNLLNVDPFDQPGVEAGKIFAFKWLQKSLKQDI